MPQEAETSQAHTSPGRNGSGVRRAIISDIHANYEALVAVLADIRKRNIDEIVCLGDVVGYGPDPEKCLALTRKAITWGLCGNHDAAVFMTHAIGFNEAASRAVAWHRSVMRPSFFSWPGRVARWRWLENLPARRDLGRVSFVHASPSDPLMDYVLEEDYQDMGFGPSKKAVERFEKFDWLCFCGHSHRPGIVTQDFKWMKPAELENMRYILPQDQKVIVNIGAVGQPRDMNPKACYVVFDGHSIQYHRVAYDVDTTQKKIRAIEALDNRLADRLLMGS